MAGITAQDLKKDPESNGSAFPGENPYLDATTTTILRWTG
jgi:hypothetical protein